MKFFTQRTLKKLTTAVVESDLTALKKQIARLDEQQRQSRQFDYQGRPVSLAELAILSGQPKALQQLLNAGCGYASEDTPLLYKAMQQTSEGLALCTVLLQAGVETEYPQYSPNSAVSACFEYCPPAKLMLFLSRLNEYGADLNLPDDKGISPLMKALQLEQQPLVQMLVNSGATIPDQIPAEWCSEAILQCAKRCAEDLRIRQIMLG